SVYISFVRTFFTELFFNCDTLARNLFSVKGQPIVELKLESLLKYRQCFEWRYVVEVVILLNLNVMIHDLLSDCIEGCDCSVYHFSVNRPSIFNNGSVFSFVEEYVNTFYLYEVVFNVIRGYLVKLEPSFFIVVPDKIVISYFLIVVVYGSFIVICNGDFNRSRI